MIDWTYGAEHELADWDRGKILPDGFGIDRKDNTIVNSNGIAACPKNICYHYGGEVNTPPTDTPEGQCHALNDLLEVLPEASINYRSNLHIHVRVPGLKDQLDTLKALSQFNEKWLRKLLPIVEPIPKPTKAEYPKAEEYDGAMKRYRRRLRSHHTVLPPERTALQVGSYTLEEFFEAEVPRSKDDKPLWHFQPRAAVNVRQLLETDTIEFRHFPGTLSCTELLTCVEWCRDYLLCFFNNADPIEHYHREYRHRAWPKFKPYVHWMEQRYQLTAADNGVSRHDRLHHIDMILEEIETCGY